MTNKEADAAASLPVAQCKEAGLGVYTDWDSQTGRLNQ